jgi:hypothetical protein
VPSCATAFGIRRWRLDPFCGVLPGPISQRTQSCVGIRLRFVVMDRVRINGCNRGMEGIEIYLFSNGGRGAIRTFLLLVFLVFPYFYRMLGRLSTNLVSSLIH